MTIALIDDQLLSAILRGRRPRALARSELYTTGHWYMRLCGAVLGASARRGVLSGPFADLPPAIREQAMAAVLQLPESIGLLSLRDLGPSIGLLRQRYQLNVLSLEALAAAVELEARVHLSASSPKLEAALRAEGLAVRRHD